MTCNHARKGIVTNQPDGYDSSRPIYAASCCGREECIQGLARKVAAETFEKPYWRPDASPRVAVEVKP